MYMYANARVGPSVCRPVQANLDPLACRRVVAFAEADKAEEADRGMMDGAEALSLCCKERQSLVRFTSYVLGLQMKALEERKKERKTSASCRKKTAHDAGQTLGCKARKNFCSVCRDPTAEPELTVSERDAVSAGLKPESTPKPTHVQTINNNNSTCGQICKSRT